MKKTLFFDNINISLSSIKASPLRTILTIMIIAIGITALVGTLTAVSSIQASLTSSFSRMGASTFNIESRGSNIRTGKSTLLQKPFSYISYKEAQQFVQEYTFPSTISISHHATRAATVKYESAKTNPNISVIGVDQNYLEVAGHTLVQGRNFSPDEIESGRFMAIIGNSIKKKLFPNNSQVEGSLISVGGIRYLVVGVLAEKGSGFGGGGDNMILVPNINVRQNFSRPEMSFDINVKVLNTQSIEIAMAEATGTFRKIRGLSIYYEDNFNISTSDSMAKMMVENTAVITLSATVIGLITLLGAAIGLMNIMLVAVTERTNEIGVRKALGANSRAIKNQFLYEAIAIGQLGGLLGVLLGILIGNVVSMTMSSPFIMPWKWIFLGLGVCFAVSILSGLLPALKASKLDPIESLRYE